ncbi:type II toxin-antitoxin system VapC family toxin [Rhizobium viscosum]|nr:type II toxin-antitoxin system VapC family toxin [Rhizobium viscosum]
MYLLDTNVLSELRRPRPHGGVLAWIESVSSDSMYVPAVVIGEIQLGIERTAGNDPAKARELSVWLQQIIDTAQCVSIDAEIFKRWGTLAHRIGTYLLVDALIAATALQKNMTVVTRNISDFQQFGVPVFNPFEYKSGS